MKKFLEILRGIGLAVLVLTVCYFGCYRKIDSYSEWAEYEYDRLTDNNDPVFYTSWDMGVIYEEYLEILNEDQLFSPLHIYDKPFKYEIRNEDRVSEHRFIGKPNGRSIAFVAPFRYGPLGRIWLGDDRFEMDWYIRSLEDIINNIDDAPDKVPWDYTIVSFLRTRFDYIYIAFEEDGRTLRCIDVQEVLWRDNN